MRRPQWHIEIGFEASGELLHAAIDRNTINVTLRAYRISDWGKQTHNSG
jgi:hypothetical protein